MQINSNVKHWKNQLCLNGDSFARGQIICGNEPRSKNRIMALQIDTHLAGSRTRNI